MDHKDFIKRLANNEGVMTGLLHGLDQKQAEWKPAVEKWSVLEVINHLYDEEREDFRHRLDLTLHHPDRGWPPNDPEKWVTERKYNERDLKESVEKLIYERRKSVDWLNSLKNPDWDMAYQHPAFGRISAGDIFCSWLAHDYFHARQISNLFMQYTELVSKPYSTRYAG